MKLKQPTWKNKLFWKLFRPKGYRDRYMLVLAYCVFRNHFKKAEEELKNCPELAIAVSNTKKKLGI